MNARISFLFVCFYIFTHAFSQTDYKIGTKNKDGYTSIYTITYKKPANPYSTTTSEYRYGLLEEKTQKIVLPIKYKSAYTSYDDGIYIVQDTLEKWGLYSAKTKKFLVEPRYNKIDIFSDGVSIVQKKVIGTTGYSDFYYGAIDKTGKLIVPDTFAYLDTYSDGLMAFKQNGQYGYMDKNAAIVIPAMYAHADNFVHGLAAVQLSDTSKYGYINKENKWVIEPKYVLAETFYEGYATVYASRKFYSMKAGNINSDKAGVIDTKGNEVVPPIYEYVSLKKTGGVFRVTIGEKYGLVDSTGKVILPVENKKIDDLYNGIMRVEKTSGIYGLVDAKGKWLLPADYNEVLSLSDNKGFYVKKDGKYSVYDKDMKNIIPADVAKRVVSSKKNIAFIFDDKVKVFDLTGKLVKTINQPNVDLYGTHFYANDDSLKVPYFKQVVLHNLQTQQQQKLKIDDLSDFNEEGIFAGKSGTKWTFYDYTGKQLTTKTFEKVINFSGGICGLQESSYSKPYLADKNFQKIAELGTVFYGPYSEGLAMSKNQYGGYLYYLDTNGGTAFYVAGEEGGACKNGRIKIKDTAKKYYFVNTSGKTINSAKYDDLGDFNNGLAGFKNNGKGGYIDTAGKIAIAAVYDDISNFSNGTAIVKQGSDYFQIDKTGKLISNAKYVAASDPNDGTFPVKKATGYGLIDNKGNTLVNFKYQGLQAASEGIAWAKKNEKWGLVNTIGAELTAFDYDDGAACDNGYVRVSKNKKWGLVDKKGKVVLPVEYTQMSKVYMNTIILVKPSGINFYSLK